MYLLHGSATIHPQKVMTNLISLSIRQIRHNLYLPPGDLLCITISGQWGVTLSVWTSYPWLSRLQPECQDVDEGGGRIRSWSSCIWSLIGRRKPQKILSKPSKINSPSSCWTGCTHTHINTHTGQLLLLWDTQYNRKGILDCKLLREKAKRVTGSQTDSVRGGVQILLLEMRIKH